MAFPYVGGHPDYSSTGSNQFIPEIWSGKLIKKYYDATVLSDITNTDYEGEIKSQGDKVIIRTIPTITISNYVVGQNLNYQRPESPSLEMLIDKGKYFGLTVDDVIKQQADVPLMDSWSTDASEQMKIAIDTDVLGTIYASADSTNVGATAGAKSGAFDLGSAGSPIALTSSNILDYIVDCGTVLDENNRPEDGRFFILPPWAINLIKKSDIKDASFSGDSGNAVLRNGRVGMLDRFTLYSSNLLASTTDGGTAYYMLFGHKQATAFASTITKMETLRAESTFGDLMRGLQIYGYKVIDGLGLGYLYAIKG